MKRIILCLTLYVPFIFFATHNVFSQVSQIEYEALVALYKATDGDNWGKMTGWDVNAGAENVTNDWAGVFVENGHVVKLSMAYENLTSEIPSEIGNLVHLKYLTFGSYQYGEERPEAILPKEIGNLTNLNTLHLNNNGIYSLPTEFGNLTNLEQLFLGSNYISELPPEIGNLTSLKWLYLGNNLISDLPESITSLQSLLFFDFLNNKFEEFPKELLNLPKLKSIELSYNNINEIPAEIANLKHLYSLELNSCNLKTFPNNILKNDSLSILELNRNSISEIPSEINQLTQLVTLDLSENNLLFGELEKIEIDNLKEFVYNDQNVDLIINSWTGGEPRTYYVNTTGSNNNYDWYVGDFRAYSSNQNKVCLVGDQEAPNKCIITNTKLPDLKIEVNSKGILQKEYNALVAIYKALDGDNWFENTGWDIEAGPESVSDEWHGLRIENGHVVEIKMMNNNLKGALPEDLGNLSKLKYLNLGDNEIVSIPSSIGQLSNLQVLDLFSNKIKKIPTTVGDLYSLTYLMLNWNEIESIPSELGGLSNLEWLFMFGNKLTVIPDEIGELSNLSIIQLTNNQITELPTALCKLPKLKDLFLDSNKIKEIPKEVSQLKALETLDLSINEISVLPVELFDLENLKFLWLDYNKISELPTAISNLKNCEMLDFYENQINKIPKEIGLLQNLKTIVLFGNQINELPNEINELKELAYLNLSENNLPFNQLEKLSLENCETLSHSGQDIIYTGRLTRTEENTILDAKIPGKYNTYFWCWENGQSYGEDSSSITIPNSSLPSLHCWVSNSMFPEQTFLITDFIKESNAEIDRSSLVELYNSTEGENWVNSTNWLSDKPIDEWYGVTTENGRLISINLPENNLIGKIPAAVGKLSMCKNIDLSNNKLNDKIPFAFCDLDSLTHLNLQNNQLTSGFEDLMLLMQSLTDLNLSNNELSGNLRKVGSTLRGLGNLETLDLSYNKLIYGIPPRLFQLPNLKKLDLSHNKFNDIYDVIKVNEPHLKVLRLNNNDLSGCMPSWLDDLLFLEEIDLSNNRFDSIPEFNDFTSLKQLNLSNNHFEFDDLERINHEKLDNFTYHGQIQLSEPFMEQDGILYYLFSNIRGKNNQYEWLRNDIAFGIGSELVIYFSNYGKFTCKVTNPEFPKQIYTETLEIDSLVNGVLRPEYFALRALYIYTGGDSWSNNTNWLSDEPVESWYGVTVENRHITKIDLSSNNLQGILPNEMEDLVKLSTLNISGNKIEDIAILTRLQGLKTLYVNDNKLVFGDIEKFSDILEYFEYSSQSKIGQMTELSPEDGSDITLNFDLTHEKNVYQWYKDDKPIEGANEKQFIIQNFDASKIGIYYCEITNPDFPKLKLQSENQCIGVLNSIIDIHNKISIYPNPISNEFNICFDGNFEQYNVVIYDISGKEIITQTLNGEKLQINTSNLKRGIYLVSLINDEERILSKKIVKL